MNLKQMRDKLDGQEPQRESLLETLCLGLAVMSLLGGAALVVLVCG